MALMRDKIPFIRNKFIKDLKKNMVYPHKKVIEKT